MAADGKGRVGVREQIDKSAAHDEEYIRIVREIQEGYSRAGWMKGGGAFDREDLAYIKDLKETERLKEEDLRSTEASEFAKLKSSLEDGLGASAAGKASSSNRKENPKLSKPAPVKPIKVVPKRPSQSRSVSPEAKRRHTGSLSPEAPKLQQQQQQQQQQPLSQQQQQQQQQQPQQQQQQQQHSPPHQQDAASEQVGLAGLLDYDSSPSSTPTRSPAAQEQKRDRPPAEDS